MSRPPSYLADFLDGLGAVTFLVVALAVCIVAVVIVTVWLWGLLV